MQTLSPYLIVALFDWDSLLSGICFEYGTSVLLLSVCQISLGLNHGSNVNYGFESLK